jgi:thymidylate synthase ThyX
MTEQFLSGDPVVKLVKHFPSSYKNVIATARTCYSSKGIIEDESIDDRWDFLAQSLYKAGHHTTLQHAHFQFAIDRVTRHFLWSFLHSHPFYNSEQVSQRYVSVKPGFVAIPKLDEKPLEIYQKCIDYQMNKYQSFCERLAPLVSEQYHARFPKRSLDSKKAKTDIKKKSQEIARYVLPLSTFAYLYHTVSGITLLRYYRLCDSFDVPTEQKIVVKKMVDELLRVEPKYAVILEEPLDCESHPEWNYFQNFHQPDQASVFLEEYDSSIDKRFSKLIDYKQNNESVLASSIREVLGVVSSVLSDREAIELVMNPSKNHLLGESMNVTTLSKLSRCLMHPAYTFRKKISHTADSQDQRHRMTPASRPILAGHLTDEPDFITPELIKQDASVNREYEEIMDTIWCAVRELRALQVNEEYVQYLLPNAVSVRFTESSDLLNLRHKLAMRLCYNAQEEIWRASLDEAIQVRNVNPTIGKYLLPPCTLRLYSKQKPICPEGDRFCGERVWEYDIDKYQRII